ncbi:MAG: universal stress protein, partial [Lachnospiraceae bacterium]|nr:universal stress protein [Lachnospiraceae bacterium]
AEESTTVVPVKVNVFPDNLIMMADYDTMMQTMSMQDSVVQMLREYESDPCMRPVLINSTNAFHAIMSVVKKEKNPLVIMGWHGSGLVKYMYGNITYQMLQEAPADVGILRMNGQNTEFQNILFPYGGGKYSKMTAKVVNRIANGYGAKITLLNVVDHEEDIESTKEYLDKSAAKFDQPTEIMVCCGDLIEKVVEYSHQYDLIVMGASLDWGIQEVVTGFRTDKIMEQAKCSVLIIKSYDIFLQRTKVRGIIHKTRRAIHQ